MMNTQVSRPVYPGSTGHGAAWKEVLVLAVDRNKMIAVCRDQLGQQMQIRCDILRAKGNLPAVNERWLVDRQYNYWTFAAIMNGGTKGVIVPQASVTGLPETLQDQSSLITNVTNQATATQQGTLGQVVAKGDLLAATQAGQVVRKPVGSDGQVLVADSSFASGLGYRSPLALTAPAAGALAATRYVGGTVSGPPTTGNFLKGDFVQAQDGNIWTCTVAGSPGTWVSQDVVANNRAANLEGRATSLESSTSALIGSGKHIWTAGGRVLNGSGGDVVLTVWDTYYNDGVAALGSGNGLFQFVRPGKWGLNFSLQSDSTTNGIMVVYILPGNPSSWGAASNLWLQARNYRHTSFTNAGALTQNISWSGRVSGSDASQAFAVHAQWIANPSSVANATLSYWMSLEYLGPA